MSIFNQNFRRNERPADPPANKLTRAWDRDASLRGVRARALVSLSWRC
jgi:hypothetical protein